MDEACEEDKNLRRFYDDLQKGMEVIECLKKHFPANSEEDYSRASLSLHRMDGYTLEAIFKR